jgi:hypothetical protein
MKKEEKTQLLFVLAPSHLALLILFISWPILYLLIFTTQPGFILGDTQNFLNSFGEAGSGTVLTTGSGNLNNTLLSDEGRQTVLWTSFLTSLLLTIIMYLIFFYM